MPQPLCIQPELHIMGTVEEISPIVHMEERIYSFSVMDDPSSRKLCDTIYCSLLNRANNEKNKKYLFLTEIYYFWPHHFFVHSH